MSTSDTTIDRFMKLFAGLNRAYGVYEVDAVSEATGKHTGRAVTRQAAVTPDLWRGHLEGKQGIGILMVRDDSTAQFGAIDVDGHDGMYKKFDPAEMAKKVAELGLPLIPCRTKSGGLHLYLFCEHPVAAGLMIKRLREMAAALGLSKKVEIFPKQERIESGRGDVGSWTNMPWFGGEESERYSFKPDGSRATMIEFLEAAEAGRQSTTYMSMPVLVTAGSGESQPVSLGLHLFPDGPPCLQSLASSKLDADDYQNDLMVNVVTYLKRACPSKARAKMFEYNDLLNDPPVDPSDLASTFKSVTRHSYFYTCSKEPLSRACDPAVCRGRKFGVGRKGQYGDGSRAAETDDETGPDESFPVLGQLRKLMTDPPLWFLDVNDKSVELDTEDLQSPKLFQKRVMETIDIMIPLPTQTSWQRVVQDLMSRLNYIEAPEDSSAAGQLWQWVEKFCIGRSSGKAKDEVLNGRPWTERGHTWFQMAHLLDFLERNKFKKLDSTKITAVFSKKGALAETWTLRGRPVNVWGVAEFKKLEPKPDGAEEQRVF